MTVSYPAPFVATPIPRAANDDFPQATAAAPRVRAPLWAGWPRRLLELLVVCGAFGGFILWLGR